MLAAMNALRLGLFMLAAFALPASGAVAGDRALLIGVSHYADPKLSLLGPDADLDAMLAAATGPLGFAPAQVRVLRDEQATGAAILAAIETWLVAQTEPGDRALLYFSGHGVQTPDQNGDEADDLDEAFAPHDLGKGFANAVRDDDIAALLSRLEGREVIVIVDACHSGTITRSLAGDSAFVPGARFIPQQSATGRTRSWVPIARRDKGMVDAGPETSIVLTAAAPYQLAWEAPVDGGPVRGLFTHALTTALAEQPGAPLAAVFERVKRRTKGLCAEAPRCRARSDGEKPTPQLEATPEALLARPLRGRRTGGAAPVAQADADVAPVVAEAAPADGVRIEGVRIEDVLASPPAGLRIATAPAPLRVGEPARIEVSSPVAGEMLLFAHLDDGGLQILFPGVLGDASLSAPRTRAVYPDEDAGGVLITPEGLSGTLYAVVAQDAVALSEVVERHRHEAYASPSEFAAALAARLSQVVAGPQGPDGVAENQNARWAFASLRIEVQ